MKGSQWWKRRAPCRWVGGAGRHGGREAGGRGEGRQEDREARRCRVVYGGQRGRGVKGQWERVVQRGGGGQGGRGAEG